MGVTIGPLFGSTGDSLPAAGDLMDRSLQQTGLVMEVTHTLALGGLTACVVAGVTNSNISSSRPPASRAKLEMSIFA